MSIHNKTPQGYDPQHIPPAYSPGYDSGSPLAYSYNTPLKSQVGISPRATLIMAGVGAVVGGAAAAAKSIRQVRANEVEGKEAALSAAKEMAGAGIATGVAAGAMSAINVGLAGQLIGTVILATGTKYLWDGVFKQEEK